MRRLMRMITSEVALWATKLIVGVSSVGARAKSPLLRKSVVKTLEMPMMAESAVDMMAARAEVDTSTPVSSAKPPRSISIVRKRPKAVAPSVPSILRLAATWMPRTITEPAPKKLQKQRIPRVFRIAASVLAARTRCSQCGLSGKAKKRMLKSSMFHGALLYILEPSMPRTPLSQLDSKNLDQPAAGCSVSHGATSTDPRQPLEMALPEHTAPAYSGRVQFTSRSFGQCSGTESPPGP
mmetsp:Transcript_86374/g.244837  ORF Transcript_86374/g.244837 Transcript_86374/m.244837 type:complete len:238 (+) Transcript_86374:1250-1963(+)